jgi:PAS domain S-box-containing protein
LPTLLAASLLIAAIHFLGVPAYVQWEQTRFQNQHQSALEQAMAGLADPLRHQNWENAATQLNRIRQVHPEWRAVVLRDAEGRQRYPLRGPGPVEGTHLMHATQEAVDESGQPLATLEILAAADATLEEEGRHAQTMEQLLIALIVLATTLSGLLQHRLLLHPLQQIAAASHELAAGHYEISLPPARDGEVGEILQALACLRDSLHADRQRRRQEQEPRLSGEHFRAILGASFGAAIGMDAEGTINEWNPQAEAMFGYRRDEALGQRFARLIIPERDHAAYAAELRRHAETLDAPTPNRRSEIVAQHRDGREFPLELSMTGLGHGVSATFIAFLRDLRERKQA